jgi:hypothetical protein
MTTAADDAAVEDAFEALLAGRPVPEEGAGLAAFTASVRATATSPGRPSAALAELLATGLLADQSSPSTRTARSAGASPPRGTRTRNRRRFAMFFPALIAKLLSAGAVAQAATGAGIVLVAFTGAGVAGVLPGPVQDTFTSIVSDETSTEEVPAEEPPVVEAPVVEAPVVEAPVQEAPVEEAPVAEAPVVEAPVAETPVDAAELTEQQWLEGPADGQSFGDWVSYGAHHGWATGQAVSSAAHDRNDDRRGGGADDGAEVEDSDDDAQGDDSSEVEDESDGDHRGRGHGRGNRD